MSAVKSGDDLPGEKSDIPKKEMEPLTNESLHSLHFGGASRNLSDTPEKDGKGGLVASDLAALMVKKESGGEMSSIA